MKHTIELPETMTVESRGQEVTLPLNGLSTDLLVKAVMHGLKQKVADAAAGAASVAAGDAWDKMNRDDRKAWTEANTDKIANEAVKLMQAVIDNLSNGEWGVERGGGSGIDPVTREMRVMARKILKVEWSKTDYKAKITDGEPTAVAAELDARWQQDEAGFRKIAEKRIKARKADAELLAELAAD